MAAKLLLFTLPDDERALLRQMERHRFTVYPELIPPGYQAPLASAELVPDLDQEAYYLAAERLGPVIVHPVKRGPDKGMLEIEEVPSPVIHYQRSVIGETGELLAGELWVELNLTDEPTSKPGKPWALRGIFEDLHVWLRKTFRRSEPKGWWVGPRAAEGWKRRELVLREAGHKGRSVGVWR